MRSFATILLLATAAIASPIVTSSKWKTDMLTEMDYEIINLARNLESLELNLWNQGLDNYTDADYASAGFPGLRPIIELFRNQEIAHFTVLNFNPAPFKNCTYKFPVDDISSFLTLSQVITTVGEGAFIGASGNLTSGAARQVGAEIIGNEARQNSYIRETIGLDFFNAINFDTPLTASQAYSLAKPFLDCPSSNPSINFTLIPPLMAMFSEGANVTHSAGDEVEIMWDAATVYLGSDVHIQFLADMYSIAAPLSQSGSGMGTVSLPQGINGTAILVATNYGGGGPIPDGQNFAIGYLVVA
ncbi:ferritin-like domain-domain-containing protein [Naematelia encephala]|uniref:Ferritin-like domain-domain-containing protein n=1 Tax=Naematelia encephala TaxID=71784 RepID=A0A1Y2BIA4_9TREE|nr:ferritin-like domain-domain-containing protein [Naematelia encephala]